MAYIEVFKGENPNAVLMGRLQHISELHKQRKQSGAYFENGLPESDMDQQEDKQKLQEYAALSHRRLSRQARVENESIKQVSDEQSADNTADQCIVEETKESDSHDINSNTNNSNSSFESPAVGERVIVQRKGRYVFGYVRFIGKVTFSDEEQIGIELDQPYGERLYLCI